ncbi:putative peptidoglycan lipid II flippase [Nocardioides zeae]|uniref:Peptidoglycan lipid II flippase n=2 Tax=Nocardioides zeae TaxID=1457234 RepID=A0ACC6IEK5_9ACTN|nr:murein biosynthesis integral membrane protein MurJ [Nocardioides zeae]MDQ1106108.1 putative peptidoglycan lipid II flippase [Nocardioides zeae]MDR6174258.1 putative peptidoglycan lipid II flippase [Nocardioides zeae]MDR6209063.1 putative peptidoglycan lipid II flippase [Nocardioides zeae]
MSHDDPLGSGARHRAPGPADATPDPLPPPVLNPLYDTIPTGGQGTTFDTVPDGTTTFPVLTPDGTARHPKHADAVAAVVGGGRSTTTSGKEPPEEPAEEPAGSAGTSSAVLGSSAIMAAGTIVSRLSGYVRGILLAAALGTKLHADIFTIANTIPNMVYILLAGGVFNAVLVPQLVRALKNDEDRGAAYVNRIVTLAVLFLGTVTVLLVVAAPWVMSIYLDGKFDGAELVEQRESAVAFARYCLPQVFFYGMFVLLGQILNARGRFGPMMWAPIANNVISVAVLVVYLVVFGPVAPDALDSAFSANQELLLGIGSTLGIVAQFAILLPYLRKAGVSLRPRFDFLGTGLGHTFRLATWTIAFVVVNQAAYTVVVRLASSGTTAGEDGTGYTVYSNALLIIMVPHSVVTVSLTTAILPRLSAAAADRDLGGLATTLAATLRTTLSFVVPAAAIVAVSAPSLANVIWGYGAARDTFDDFIPTLVLFAPAIVLFTVHYMMLRGFYALEQTRRVFWIQCVIAAVNVSVALLLVSRASAQDTVPALVVAYGVAYGAGALVSYSVLSRTVGGLGTARTLGFGARLLVAVGLASALAWGLRLLLEDHLALGSAKLEAIVTLGLLASVLGGTVVLLARLLRIDEVNEVVDAVVRRVRPARRR